MIWLLVAQALAADIHVLVESEGWSQEITNSALEPFTETYGPLEQGKLDVAYTITWPPPAHSAMDNGYPLRIQLCRVWAKGKKKDKDCITEQIVAHPEDAEKSTAEALVKLTQKWTYKLTVWATGDDIPSTGLPMGEPPSDE